MTGAFAGLGAEVHHGAAASGGAGHLGTCVRMLRCTDEGGTMLNDRRGMMRMHGLRVAVQARDGALPSW